jgi:hypothetical protein
MAGCDARNRSGASTGLVAIVTFRRRTGSLTGPANVVDGDTIVVADQLVRLHGIDAPELDETFWWRGQQIACGTMSLAALEALIAGVKMRCEVIDRERHGRLVAKVFSPNGPHPVGGPWRTGGTRRMTSSDHPEIDFCESGIAGAVVLRARRRADRDLDTRLQPKCAVLEHTCERPQRKA